MNEDAGPPTPPGLPPLVQAERDGALWLKSLRVMRENPRAVLLPLTVTQLPFAVATAAVFFYLFYEAYPNAEFTTFDWLADAPNGVRLTIVMLGAAQTLFSLVGAAATMVAVSGIARGAPVGLAQSLDPAFTRMGGLLLFGVLFNVLLFASFVGVVLLVYFIVRWGLAIQPYVLEGKGFTASLGESWRLLRGRMLSFFALLLTAIPFGLVFLLAFSLVFSLLSAPFGTDPGRTQELVLQSLALFIVGVTFVPFGAYLATSTTLFYLSAKDAADG